MTENPNTDSALQGKLELKKIEGVIREHWESIDLPHLLEEELKKIKPTGYVEGPPTLNGEPHIGHIRGRIIKDLWYRFSTLNKQRIIFRAGWDTQGLPVELQAEKEVGLTGSKTDNLKVIGEEALVKACKNLVNKYYEKWRKTDKLLGMSFDYNKAYWTYKDDYIEREWKILKAASKKGLLGEGFKVVAYCPSCQTSLSHAEVSQGYEMVEDPSLFYKVKIVNNDAYLILWTTMPFTVITDEMVGVSPEAEYVYIKVNDETWIVGKERLIELMKELKVEKYNVQRTVYGRELEGLHYIHPLAEVISGQQALQKDPRTHIVVAEKFVDITTGTGIVHMSPANGEEDFDTANKRKIPIFNPIDDQVRFTKEAGIFNGFFVRDTDQKVSELLDSKGALLKLGKITHQYPTCWRSHHKVVWLARREYFYWVDKLGDLAVEAASKVEYFYEPPKNRFIEIVKEKIPWCISRERIWGAPLPIWVCTKCNHKEGLFSRKDIIENSIELPDGDKFELHRPWIDRVITKCPKCGGRSIRESFVLDTWHNSGASSYAGFKDDESAELIPASFLTEGIDQTRGWAYTLLIENVILKGKPIAPFKSFLFQGHVLDSKGNKMSKSIGNVVDGMTVLSELSVDALRFYLLWKTSPLESINYSSEELRTRSFQVLNTLYHIHLYFQQNSHYDKFNSLTHTLDWVKENKLFTPTYLWILSKLQTLIQKVTVSYERCRYHEGLRSIEQFLIENLSQTFIPMTRTIIWDDNPDTKDGRLAIYSVLHEALKTVNVLLHPASPFLTEYLHQKGMSKDKSSIMLENWPKTKEELIDNQIEEEFDCLKQLVTIMNNARMSARIKRRWPLKKAVIIAKDMIFTSASKHINLLQEMTNIKKIEVLSSLDNAPLRIQILPKLDVLGRKLKNKIQMLQKYLEQSDTNLIYKDIKEMGFLKIKLLEQDFEIHKDELIFEYKPEPGYIQAKNEDIMALLFVDRDNELISEGILRDLARRLQALRKDKNYEPTEILELAQISNLDDEWVELIKPRIKELTYLVRVKRVEIVSKTQINNDWSDAEIDGKPIKISIN